MKWVACALGALLCALQPAAAQEPFIVGVQTHFGVGPGPTDPQKVRAWMAQAGLHSSRDEMYWDHVEDGSGRLSLARGAAYTDSSWQSMPKDFKPLLIVSYGHPRYDGGGQPQSPEAMRAFARYAGFVVGAAARPVAWAEVWNEWNGKAGARPGNGSNGDPLDYVRLVQAVAPAVKSASPSTHVLVGSMSEDYPDWTWTRRAIAGGLLAKADGLSVHLYNHCRASRDVGADEMLARLDELHSIVVQAGMPRMPIHVTEIGWPTHDGRCGVTENDAALHTVRFLLEAAQRNWIHGVWLYEFMDGGDKAGEQEHRFGLLRRNGTEKPAGCAVRVLGPYLARRPVAVQRAGAVNLARYKGESSDLVVVWVPRGVQQRVRVHGDAPGSLAAQPVCDVAADTFTIASGGEAASAQLQAGIAFLRLRPGASARLELAP